MDSESTIPAVAVIDSQNVKHWGSKVLGRSSDPDPTAIRKVMGSYGFDVQHCYVGLALWKKHQSPPRLENSGIRKASDEYHERLMQLPNVTPLVGHFGWEGTEKQVDVRIAIQVVLTDAERGQTVLLFSEDRDLDPAVEAARDRGVKVVRVVCTDTFRPGAGRLWLLATSLAEILNVSDDSGGDVRSRLLEVLDKSQERHSFEVLSLDGSKKRFFAHGPGGLVAVGRGTPRIGSSLEWFVTGFEPTHCREFPQLLISPKPFDGFAPLEASISQRSSATMAFLTIPGVSGPQTMYLPAGGPAVGSKVVVRPSNSRDVGWSFVAARPRPSRTMAEQARVGVVLPPRHSRDVTTMIKSHGEIAVLDHAHQHRYEAFDRLAVWTHFRAKRGPHAVALSDPLP
jgi:hypothetical protein